MYNLYNVSRHFSIYIYSPQWFDLPAYPVLYYSLTASTYYNIHAGPMASPSPLLYYIYPVFLSEYVALSPLSTHPASLTPMDYTLNSHTRVVAVNNKNPLNILYKYTYMANIPVFKHFF